MSTSIDNNHGKMSNAQGISSAYGREKSQKDDEYIYNPKVASDDESSTFPQSGPQTFTKIASYKRRAPRDVPRDLVFFNAAEKRMMREFYKTNQHPSKQDIETMIKVDFAGKNYTVKKIEVSSHHVPK
jgi:hypothetical protein